MSYLIKKTAPGGWDLIMTQFTGFEKSSPNYLFKNRFGFCISIIKPCMNLGMRYISYEHAHDAGILILILYQEGVDHGAIDHDGVGSHALVGEPHIEGTPMVHQERNLEDNVLDCLLNATHPLVLGCMHPIQ